jgi:hypothetical protein
MGFKGVVGGVPFSHCSREEEEGEGFTQAVRSHFPLVTTCAVHTFCPQLAEGTVRAQAPGKAESAGQGRAAVL